MKHGARKLLINGCDCLGVFSNALMNAAVYKFKRYEDASLSYSGINRHEGEDIGLFSTVVSAEEYLEFRP